MNVPVCELHFNTNLPRTKVPAERMNKDALFRNSFSRSLSLLRQASGTTAVNRPEVTRLLGAHTLEGKWLLNRSSSRMMNVLMGDRRGDGHTKQGVGILMWPGEQRLPGRVTFQGDFRHEQGISQLSWEK